MTFLSATGYWVWQGGAGLDLVTRWQELALKADESVAPQTRAAELVHSLKLADAPKLANYTSNFLADRAALFDLVVLPFTNDEATLVKINEFRRVTQA